MKPALSKQETLVLSRWMEAIAEKHEAQFIATLPPERRESIEHLSQTERRRMMLRDMMWRRWPAGGGRPGPAISDDDLAELRKQLSPETSTWLTSKKEADQRRIVAGWMHQMIRQRFQRGPLNPSDELLANFFDNGLSPQQREQLLVLPGEEMQRELLRMYLRRTRPGEGDSNRSDAAARGDRPSQRRGVPKRMPKAAPEAPGAAGD